MKIRFRNGEPLMISLRSLAYLVGIAVLLAGSYALFVDKASRFPLRDYNYYRAASSAIELGENPYTSNLKDDLPTYLYPPPVAIILGALEAPTHQETKLRWCTVNFILLLLCSLLLAEIVRKLGGFSPLASLFAALFLFIGFEPTSSTVAEGQVNFWVLAPLLMHLLLLMRGCRISAGAFIALAGMIKLTPLLFALPFLIRRDLRLILGVALGSVATIGVCLLLEPRALALFWDYLLALPSLAQDSFIISKPANLSLHGVLARNLVGGGLWTEIVSLLVVGAVLVYELRAPSTSDQQLALRFAFCTISLLLLSPILWAHHLVWSIPALSILFAVAPAVPVERRYRRAIGLLLCFGALSYITRLLYLAFGLGPVAVELVKLLCVGALIALGYQIYRESKIVRPQ